MAHLPNLRNRTAAERPAETDESDESGSPCIRFAVHPTATITPDGRVQINVSLVNCGPADVSVNLEVRLDDAGNLVIDHPSLTLSAGQQPVDLTLKVEEPFTSPDASLTMSVNDPDGGTLLSQDVSWTPKSAHVTWIRKPAVKVTGIAAGVAAAATACLLILPPSPNPIDPVGTWDVAGFIFTPTEGEVSNLAPLEGGEMTIEREPGCAGDDCNLVITSGPELIAGVVLEPQAGRSRYVGTEVVVFPTCDGARPPAELTRGRFIAEKGSGNDLSFIIESELTEPWYGCDPFAFRYAANAERISAEAVAADLDRAVAVRFATRSS